MSKYICIVLLFFWHDYSLYCAHQCEKIHQPEKKLALLARTWAVFFWIYGLQYPNLVPANSGAIISELDISKSWKPLFYNNGGDTTLTSQCRHCVGKLSTSNVSETSASGRKLSEIYWQLFSTKTTGHARTSNVKC